MLTDLDQMSEDAERDAAPVHDDAPLSGTGSPAAAVTSMQDYRRQTGTEGA